MKKFINIISLLISITALAQIKGNKEIITRTFDVDNIEHIKINFYAEVIIDHSKEESLTITTDANLFEYIEKEIVDGTLHLDQKEWISPSKNVKIIIGAPNLKKVESGTHDVTRIINLDNEYLQVLAPIGTIIVEGKTKDLRIAAELAKIDASDLIAENANVNIWSRGSANVNVTNELYAKLDKDAILKISNTPKVLRGDAKKTVKKNNKNTNASVRYIKFKIKNNAITRNHFLVIGPKPDGRKFSYGFPMMPQATRKENWTIGTKVYKVSTLGKRKLLVTIKEENENKTVNLF
ncbi:GIN domain-containing protein [Aquimarina sp. 2201CG14-23]|uniref:GIN domain-containing protein n=1 Tax=Aquimarina mycalae TaxID=3040073 RepID=UPI00247828B4|nr:DUF2807 domain-containing protein [Aquimarina sp. 2201CG14-23]MDH7446512.1 DUF2807 domain-containing protein [Aquimarina sp. 2201CG14-23]